MYGNDLYGFRMANFMILAYGIGVYTPFWMATNGIIPPNLNDKKESKINELMGLLKNGDISLDDYDERIKILDKFS